MLLLIQLRRQNSITARAIEQCCTDIHDVQVDLQTRILLFFDAGLCGCLFYSYKKGILCASSLSGERCALQVFFNILR